ncbi:hypothetical protein IFO69_12230 [Echinicola sp. CAU 1574]|uniref:Translocation/assembly module TamB n=1 Tax=Echinicola arenosa TaxID=2774144 RepID=A0ABR9APH3_9BACT|nr:hypothetical protein [Echinicola arenosa]MBD8489514.1 hypothetical protein [Echinicola arenosa]
MTNSFLDQNGISFGDVDFDFSGAIEVSDISVDQSELSIEAKSLSLNWHWSDLWNKKLEGDFLKLSDATIHYLNTGKAQDTGDSYIPKIQLKHIDLKNIYFTYVDDQDTISWSVDAAKLTRVDFDQELIIDSLILNGTKGYLRFGENINKNIEENIGIGGLPTFKSKVVDIQNGEILMVHAAREYKLNDISLKVEDLSGAEIWKTQLNELSLVYQDTVQLSLNWQGLVVNGETSAKMDGLSFKIPGIQFQVDKFNFANNLGLEADVIISEGQIDTYWLQQFFPDLDWPFKENKTVDFKGQIHYENSSLDFQGFQFGFANHSTISLGGKVGDWQSSLAVELNEIKLSTTLFDLLGFLEVEIPKDQKNWPISGDFSLIENESNYLLDGNLSLNHTSFSIGTTLSLKEDHTALIDFELISGKFFLEDLLNSEYSFQSSPIYLSGQTSIAGSEGFSDFQGSFKSDTLSVQGYGFKNPSVSVSREGKTAHLEIKYGSEEEYSLDLSSLNLQHDFSMGSFSGELKGKLPLLMVPDQQAGEIKGKLNGEFRLKDGQQLLAMDVDSLIFYPASYDTNYLLNAHVMFENAKSSFSGEIGIDERLVLKAKADKAILDWWETSSRWNSEIPDFDLYLSSSIDSSFLSSLTGIQVGVDLEELSLNSNQGVLLGKLASSYFSYGNIYASGISADVNYQSQHVGSEIFINSLDAGGTKLDSLSTIVTNDERGVYLIDLETLLPGLKDRVQIGFELESLTKGILVRFQEQGGIRWGREIWSPEINDGIYFLTENKDETSQLAVTNEGQRITYRSSVHGESFKVDSLLLDRLINSFYPDINLEGTVNGHISSIVEEDATVFEINGSELKYGAYDLGSLVFIGSSSKGKVGMDLNLFSPFGDIKAKLENKEADGPVNLDLIMEEANLGLLTALFPDQSEIKLSGISNGKVHGTFHEGQRSIEGFFTFNNSELIFDKPGFYMAVPEDTIFLQGDDLVFDQFVVLDREGDQLTLDGKLGLGLHTFYDLQVFSEHFDLVNKEESGNIKGKMEVNTDLMIKGSSKQMGITGSLNTVDGAKLQYTYEGTITTDRKEDEVIFMSFDQSSNKDSTLINRRIKEKKVIDWNVDVAIGTTDLSLMFNSTSQDYAQLTAEGSLFLRKGNDETPLVTGKVQSLGGNLFYQAPMVSDLDLKILDASIEWLGDLYEPRFTFHGSEVFRIIVDKAIVPQSKRNTRIPVTVLAKVENSDLDDYDLQFDINSTDPDLASYLTNLPLDTRKTYAMNLLLFGNLDPSFSTGGASYMESLVSKLNDITRKNIKNADLTFYVRSEGSANTTDKIGYSFSKGLFHEKVKFAIGGSLDMSEDHPDGAKAFNPIGSVELRYVISTKPEISIMAARKDVYRGIIDGNVNESSLGLSFQKRYPNLFNRFKRMFDQ